MDIFPSDLYLPPKFSDFRVGQWDIALSMADSPQRFCLMSSPPGSGKTLSFFTSCLLRSKRALILTPSKAHQWQLMDDFSSMGLDLIVGHSSYPCASRSSDTDDDSDADISCLDGQNCEYRSVDIPRVQRAPFVTTNYQHWIALAKFGDPHRLGHFDTIVLDEAHEADKILCSQIKISIRRSDVELILQQRTPESSDPLHAWISWSRSCIDRLTTLRAKKSDDLHFTRKLNNLYRELSRLAHIQQKTESWIVERASRGVTISPVWGRPYTEQYLFRGAEKIILSSGTLTPLDAEYLGIDPDPSNLLVHDQDSTFHPSRRPIVYVPTTRVDWKMNDGQRLMLARKIDRVIEMYGQWKGLIHSISYDYSDMIYRLSENQDLILQQSKGHIRDTISDFFAADPPLILCGPAFAEGFDFIHDRARWQVIFKVPFLNRQDPITDARCKDDKRYSLHTVSKKIVQMSLRIVRDRTDWGVTFIFDNHWGDHFSKNTNYFPGWFRAAWRRFNTVPDPETILGDIE